MLGLKYDFAIPGSKPNADGFELFLRQLVENSLSVVTAETVRISFHEIGPEQICEVSVAASGRPVFAKPPKGTGLDGLEFWVRVGNATRQLHGDEMVQYQNQHWG